MVNDRLEYLDIGVIMNPFCDAPFQWQRVCLSCGTPVLVWAAPAPKGSNSIAIGMGFAGLLGGYGFAAAAIPQVSAGVHWFLALLLAAALGFMYREGFSIVARSRFRVIHPHKLNASEKVRIEIEISFFTSLHCLRSVLRSKINMSTLVTKRKSHYRVKSARMMVWRPVFMPAKRENTIRTLQRGRRRFVKGDKEGCCFVLEPVHADTRALFSHDAVEVDRVIVASAWQSRQVARASEVWKMLVSYIRDFELHYDESQSEVVYTSVVTNPEKWFKSTG